MYGGFAALPLFLVWLNFSWLIVLFGAEISFAAQNHRKYEFESDIKSMNRWSHRIVSVYIFNEIVQNFLKGEPPLTSPKISEKLKLPVRVVRHILYELVEINMIIETPGDVNKDVITSYSIHYTKLYENTNINACFLKKNQIIFIYFQKFLSTVSSILFSTLLGSKWYKSIFSIRNNFV